MKINEKIAWLFTTMGYGEQLLYWEPILSELTKSAPNTLIYLTPGKVLSKGSNLTISESIKIFRITLRSKKINAYNRVISVISPKILVSIWKYKPEVIILSEFGLLTIYGILYKRLRPRCKAILLVESDPGNIPKHKTFTRKLICKYVDLIMTNNASGNQYLQTILQIESEKIVCKPYLVSEPVTTPPSESQLNDKANEYINCKKVKLLYVGQLAIRKGVDNLIKAIANLNPILLKRTQLAIVGAGSDADTNRLTSLTEQLQIEQSVTFVGRVPYNDLDILYKTSNVFVLPTLNDYRALVGFEAISYGLPVLLSIHDGSSNEIVDEGKNGYTFDPNNIEEFTNKLEKLVTDEKVRHDFSMRSLSIASTFTSEIAANNLIDTINQCIHRK